VRCACRPVRPSPKRRRSLHRGRGYLVQYRTGRDVRPDPRGRDAEL